MPLRCSAATARMASGSWLVAQPERGERPLGLAEQDHGLAFGLEGCDGRRERGAEALAGEARPAGPEAPPLEPRVDPAPGKRRQLVGLGEGDRAIGRGAHERGRERVLGVSLERRREPQRLVLIEPVEGADRGESWRARGERAGLVERDDADAGEIFERRATLDQDAVARGRGADRRDHRDRDRDHERARAGDDQERERAVDPGRRVGAEQDRDHGERERSDEDERRVDAREAVDETLRRRAAPLRLLDQLDDARDRRIGGETRGAHDERAELVERALRRPDRRAHDPREPTRR